MKPKKISAFWQAVVVAIIAYLLFDNAFPPLMPKTLMIQYMVIVIVGLLLYFSFDDDRWEEFKSPILAVLREDRLRLIRWFFLLVIPGIVGYNVYMGVKPSFDAPVELRQVHPAPPSKLKVFGKRYDLTTLENPVRTQVLEELKEDVAVAKETYNEAVDAGREVYFQNCFYCHGGLLDGDVPFAKDFNPLPANFQDVGTIAQLQEAFLFWRITTGGPGLPKEGTPWNSAMPVWHEMLGEDDVWNVITFLYDYVGQVPRIWDPEVSKAVTRMKDEAVAARKNMSGVDIYQFRCAACHGEEGVGDGPAADFLYPRPRDFSLGLFKYKSTPGSTPIRDEDLFNTIKFGLPGTGMPGWSSLLSDADINKLVPVIKEFDTTATFTPEDADDDAFDDDGRYLKDDLVSFSEAEPAEGQIAYSDESIKKGKVAYKACAECHGKEGRGNITSGKRLEDDWGYRIWPRDLSKPWTWRATNVEGATVESKGNTIEQRDATIESIYKRLSIGIPGTPMPAHRAVEEGNKDPISLEDRWHVANYVYSLREGQQTPGQQGIVRGIKAESGTVPTDLDDMAWENVPKTTLRMVPNIIKEDRLFTPLNDAISVRVLYDDENIAFLLEVNDRTDSRPGEPVSTQIQDEDLQLHPDAFAIQLPKQDSYESSPVIVKPLYRHGDGAHPTTIWYWNAGAYSSPEPPQGELPERGPQSVVIDASGPNVKLAFRNDSSDLAAQGKWEKGKWRVLMTRPRVGGDSGDIDFVEGQFIPVSFANWDGSNGEVGSKHTLTSWYWLLLPPIVDPVTVYGWPVGIAFLVFLVGLLLVSRQKKLR